MVQASQGKGAWVSQLCIEVSVFWTGCGSRPNLKIPRKHLFPGCEVGPVQEWDMRCTAKGLKSHPTSSSGTRIEGLGFPKP